MCIFAYYVGVMMLVAASAFHSTATAYLNYTRVGDEVSIPKMSTVPKCLLWQNVYSQNVYLAKMSTVPKCSLPKCLLSRLNPEGPFMKEISLRHKEFSRYFGILQPVLTVYNGFVFWKIYDS